jgi:ribose transport system permease protein
MPPDPSSASMLSSGDLGIGRERSVVRKVLAAQPFWVAVAVAIICAIMTYLQPASFASSDNFYNITRNFAFIGIMALGMTAVIVTGGIDLSVGSVMGLV